VPLPLLGRQSPDVANQKILSLETEVQPDPLALALECLSYGRLESVIHAPHARWIAHTARDGEARDVVGDGDNQILARRDGVVDKSDERVEEEAIVVVARRYQKRRTFADLSHRQRGIHVGAEQVRVDDVVPAAAQQADQPAQRERIQLTMCLQEVDRNIRRAKGRQQLAFTPQDRYFEVERGSVSVREEREQVIFRSAAIQRGNQLEDAYSAVQPPEPPLNPTS
jgi:hypothetical protein